MKLIDTQVVDGIVTMLVEDKNGNEYNVTVKDAIRNEFVQEDVYLHIARVNPETGQSEVSEGWWF